MRPCFFAFILGLAPVLALAQPREVSRTLRNIDFEERRLGNAEDLPMHWMKLTGEGLPHYVNGRLTSDLAHGGQYSFRLDLNGGSLIYRYASRQIRVQSGAHYRVEGFARTTVLPHARARISAFFTDVDTHPLPQTTAHSEPYAATSATDDWTRLAVELTAPENAAYLVIELGLLQPELYASSTLGQRALYAQDINGSAWFDDVSISQVPQVVLSTDRPGNIFRAGDAPRVWVLVNDRFTDDLAAQLVVRDAQARTVFQRSGALDMSAAETLGPGRKRMSLLLPELKPGWYEASLVMTSHGQFVGRQDIHLVRLADDAPLAQPDARFGIIATGLPFDGWEELPGILPFLGAGRVKLAVWSQNGDVQQMNAASFDRLLDRLASLGITPTACLVDPPPSIAGRMNDPSWLGILTHDRAIWQPQLAYLVARHANHLDRWQLGDDGSDAFVTRPAMRQVYDRIYDEFAKLIRQPDLAMPWPAWYELEGKLPATVALSVPPSILPAQIPLYMDELKNQRGHNLSISLQLLDGGQYGREVQIRDLAQRVVYALAGGAERIDLPLPFSVRRDKDQLIKQPRELLMIDRTLITTLGGCAYRGQVPLAEGVEAFLFDKSGLGILVLWDRNAEPRVRDLAINVSEQALQMDLWGNASKLARIDDSEGGKVRLLLGPTPIFLIGVDAQLAQLRASIALDRPLLESSFEPHPRRIRFINPYRQAIGGSFRLKAPAGWTINPPTQSFTLNPGETLDREITIEFPYNSFAGPKIIQGEFTIAADRTSTFIAPIVLKLGLSDVGMQTLALRDGKDVIIQQIISNYGEKPIDYTAFAMVPGQARQERLVTGLAAGRTTLKRYRFQNVTLPAGATVRVGVKELDGTRILNDEVAIE